MAYNIQYKYLYDLVAKCICWKQLKCLEHRQSKGAKFFRRSRNSPVLAQAKYCQFHKHIPLYHNLSEIIQYTSTCWILSHVSISSSCLDRGLQIGLSLLYCTVAGSRRIVPPDALQPKAYRTNPGLYSFLLAPPGVSTRDPSSERRNYLGEKWPMNFAWKCPTST